MEPGVIKHFLLHLLIKLQAFYHSIVYTNLDLDKEIKCRKILLKKYAKGQDYRTERLRDNRSESNVCVCEKPKRLKERGKDKKSDK